MILWNLLATDTIPYEHCERCRHLRGAKCVVMARFCAPCITYQIEQNGPPPPLSEKGRAYLVTKGLKE